MRQLLILTVTIFISSILTTAIATAIETNVETIPTVVEYPTKLGMVTFSHENHQLVSECSSCHHTGDNIQCKTCHGIDKEIPSTKVAYHNQCKGCHSTNKLGPTSCKQCHKR